MNLRLRFVTKLTLVISAIFIVALIIIYLLSSNARKKDYEKRLWAQGYSAFQNYYQIIETDTNNRKEFQNYFPASLSNTSITFINDSGRVLFSSQDTVLGFQNPQLLVKIKSTGKIFFYEGQNQIAGLYFSANNKSAYVFISAYDKYGISRLSTLKLIMFLVAIASIFIIWIFSFSFVSYNIKPLVKLSVQMRRITEKNLSERVKINESEVKGNEILQMTLNFNYMLDRLQQAFEMQRSFVHYASHELRTPLSSMLLQTEAALKNEIIGDNTKEVLKSLREDQQYLIELTNSLLMLSQYERVFYTSDWPLVRIDEIIYDCINEVKSTMPELSITVDFLKIPENELHLAIKGNEPLLYSAFSNLIKNAFQYSENNKVAIFIEASSENININFENDGDTINEADIEKLFLPFFRGENAIKKKGFGLGLSIVDRVLVLHKASIKYEAVSKNLNRFIISF